MKEIKVDICKLLDSASRKDIAAALGVSASTVSDWLTGKNFPSRHGNLLSLANQLGIPAPSLAEELTRRSLSRAKKTS